MIPQGVNSARYQPQQAMRMQTQGSMGFPQPLLGYQTYQAAPQHGSFVAPPPQASFVATPQPLQLPLPTWQNAQPAQFPEVPDGTPPHSHELDIGDSDPEPNEKNMRRDDCADGPDACCGGGQEAAPPKPENLFLGIDTRPLLPVGLALSTVMGALVMLIIQVPWLSRLLTVDIFFLYGCFGILYGVTLGTMAYTALADPGQLREDQMPGGLDSSMDAEGEGRKKPKLPKRCHKSWQYKRPIRRYDHYCRWVTNVIGMHNHRPFFVMLTGLNIIGVVGIAADLIFGASLLQRGQLLDQTLLTDDICVLAHLGYSIGLIFLASPIFKIHLGLVSRNELAAEWKSNTFYTAKKSSKGTDVSVNDLSDEEFNQLFDAGMFHYDKSKNHFDKGLSKNCWNFWCHSRWSANDLGDF